MRKLRIKQDRRGSFSPPVVGGRRSGDREEHLNRWINDLEDHVAEVEAMVQSVHEIIEKGA